jgi:hypothetical protein
MVKYILEEIDGGRFVESLPITYNEKEASLCKTYSSIQFTHNAFKAQIFTLEEIEALSVWLDREWTGCGNPIKIVHVMGGTFTSLPSKEKQALLNNISLDILSKIESNTQLTKDVLTVKEILDNCLRIYPS